MGTALESVAGSGCSCPLWIWRVSNLYLLGLRGPAGMLYLSSTRNYFSSFDFSVLFPNTMLIISFVSSGALLLITTMLFLSTYYLLLI